MRVPTGRWEGTSPPGNQVRPGTEQPDSGPRVPWDSGVEEVRGAPDGETSVHQRLSHFHSSPPTGDVVPCWVIPTTADVGLRARADEPLEVMRELALGMQRLILDEAALPPASGESRWMFRVPAGRWSDAVAYLLEDLIAAAEVERRFVTDLTLRGDAMEGQSIDVEARHVSTEDVEQDLDVKAVTRHELRCEELYHGDRILGVDGHAPVIDGPCWWGQAILDI